MIPALLAAAACLPALAVAGALFDSAGYLPPLAGAVAVAGLLACATARRVSQVCVVWLLGIAGGAVYGVGWTVATGGPPGAAPRALRDGWQALLSVAVPAHPRADLLLPLGAIAWSAAFAAVVAARRTMVALAPAGPVLLGLAAMLVLVGRAGRAGLAQVLPTAATVALLLAAAALRARPPGGAPARASGPGLALVALVALAGTGAALVVPVGARYAPRDHYHPPVDGIALPNPLGLVRAELSENPARTVFTVRFDTDRPPADRVAVAELGDFDGATWSDTSRFVRVDRALPAAPGPAPRAARRAEARATVTLAELGGSLLPTVGQPRAISGAGWAGTAYAPDSGAIVATEPPRGQRSYTLTSQVPAPTRDQLERAAPATDPSARRYLTLPDGLPGAVRAAAARATASAGRPYAKLVALADYLRDSDRFPYDLSASPGHSYGVIDRLLTGTGPGDQRGYAEQHATAFAVLARALGFPARIGVGYLLDDSLKDTDGTFTVTTRQAHAWPEVLLAGIGWVAFEPTDTSALTRHLPPPSTPAGGTRSGPSVSSELSPPVVTPELDRDAADGVTGTGTAAGLLLAWLLPALAAGALLSTLAGIVGAKAVRRARRRHRRLPAARVEGAWKEVRDRLAERGVPRAPAWSHREVTAAAQASPGLAGTGEPLRRLAALADQAMYFSGGVGPAQADEAWRLVGEVRRLSRHAGGVRRRLRAACDPRVLLLPAWARPVPPPEVPLADRRLVRRPPAGPAAPRETPDLREQPVLAASGRAAR